MIRSGTLCKEIFENSPTGIIIFDHNGTIKNINPMACNILEQDRKTILKSNTNIHDILQSENLHLKILEEFQKNNFYYICSHKIYVNKKIKFLELKLKNIKSFNDKNMIVVYINDTTSKQKAIENLIDAKEEWKAIIDNMVNVFIQTDKNGNIIKTSPSVKNILGYNQNEVIGKNIIDFYVEKEKISKIRKSYLTPPIKAINFISSFFHKNGHNIILEINVSPRFDRIGQYIGSDNILKDITDIKKSNEQLQLYREIIEKTSEGIIITDHQNRIIYVNDAFCKITGYKKKEVLGNDPKILKSNLHNSHFYKTMWKNILQNGSWRGEIWNRHKNGVIYPELLSINTIKDENDCIKYHIAIFSDITKIKKTEEKIRHLALHDSLTSLPNRTMLTNILIQSISNAKRINKKVALLFLDLDNFKIINDNHGHHEGDKILIETARRLKNSLRANDIVCRFGGDEFIIILEYIKDEKDIIEIAKKINNSIKLPYYTEKSVYHIGCSIGISIYPEDALFVDELIKKADTAMYDAKNRGKNRYSFYSHKLGKKVSRELYMENLIREGIKDQQFKLYYQPKISLSNNKIVGLEALIRWNHPKLGLITPNDFIEFTEKTGLIIPLGNWILKTACSKTYKWKKEGIFNGTISVNISGVQIDNQNFLKVIIDILNETNFDPNFLNLEITESTLMQNPQKWKKLFLEAKKIGISISIDDFGTGYSSLSYLRQLPIDELKIDKSFIDDIPDDKDACVIIKAIIALSKNLGYKTVAEGVESEYQTTYLKENNCDIIQGYYFSKPLNVSEIKEFLVKHSKN